MSASSGSAVSHTTNKSSAPATSPTDGSSTTLLPSSDTSTTPSSQTVATSTTTASSAPESTQLVTSIVTASNTGTTSQGPQTVIVTQTTASDSQSSTDTTSSTSSTSSSTAVNANGKSSHNGLTAGGKTAIAVVIPVVVVALLLIACLFLWRKRKQRKNEEEERKKEMEEYGYNPNHDPTLPAVAATDEITEDHSGYRGWGNTGNATRKPSTTVSGGMAQLSDGGYHSPGSPTHGASVSDQNSENPLMGHLRDDSETMGNVPPGTAVGTNNAGVQRGPSNASSAYSAGDNAAGDAPGQHVNGQQDYYTDNAYYQPGPYENQYGGGQQPIIRDNPARRNTRIERPDVFPHQGTSGIAQNF